MDRSMYWKIMEYSQEPEVQEGTIAYLAEHLGKFLRPKERVLICFFEHKQGNLSWVMEQAVLRCNCVPVIWGPDHRWKTLLQQAFFSAASAIIGPPLILLGLAKLRKHMQMPLPVRKVITAGYPNLDWMIDGIEKGLDCEAGGCFTLGESAAVAGFACGRALGIHLREDVYGVDIVDPSGKILPPGETGEIVLYPKQRPQLRYPMGENAKLDITPCPCGSNTSRLLGMQPGRTEDPELVQLGQQLQSWTSILDCRLRKGECGLEVEIVCFPGEKLPKLPTAAKLVIRPWSPKNDEPFWYMPTLNVAGKSEEKH